MGLLDKVASKLLQFTDYGRLTGRADELNKKTTEFFKRKNQVQDKTENVQVKINDLDAHIKEQREQLQELIEKPIEDKYKEIKYLPKDEE